MATIAPSSEHEGKAIPDSGIQNQPAVSPPAYEEDESPPLYMRLFPPKKFFDRMYTPRRTALFFILGAIVLVFSYMLLLSGLPGSALKNSFYIYRIQMSYNVYEWRNNGSLDVSSPDAEFITVYPTNYCVQNFSNDTKANYQPFECHGMSVPYVFDVYKEFPTRAYCSIASFTAYKNRSKLLSNSLLGAVIVNSLWLLNFILMTVYRTVPLFVLNLVFSLTSLILSFMVAYTHDQPGGAIKKLVKSCFYPSPIVWGASTGFKVLSCCTIVFSVVQLISFAVFWFKDPINKTKKDDTRDNETNAGALPDDDIYVGGENNGGDRDNSYHVGDVGVFNSRSDNYTGRDDNNYNDRNTFGGSEKVKHNTTTYDIDVERKDAYSSNLQALCNK
ncbi:hypothetical protein, no similarity [Geotrichum candidum]|uniref:Uncharacterized protein n=1 Tax=Geotrichum candidum TaxID=1173061 RepID=A0A0J9XED1_GEOCN|nr:hypothetical protein, no similarity [Geotrichum candidum]